MAGNRGIDQTHAPVSRRDIRKAQRDVIRRTRLVLLRRPFALPKRLLFNFILLVFRLFRFIHRIADQPAPAPHMPKHYATYCAPCRALARADFALPRRAVSEAWFEELVLSFSSTHVLCITIKTCLSCYQVCTALCFFFAPLLCQRDWCCIAKPPAPAPSMLLAPSLCKTIKNVLDILLDF